MRRLIIWGWIVLAVTLSSCQQSKPQRARKAIERGQKSLDERQLSRALLEFRLAQRLDPRSADVYFHLGNGYLATGQPSAAYINFRKALQFDTNHGGTRRAAAQLLASSRHTKDLEEAVRPSESLRKLDPGDKDTANALAIAKCKSGHREEAEALLSESAAMVIRGSGYWRARSGKRISNAATGAAQFRRCHRSGEPRWRPDWSRDRSPHPQRSSLSRVGICNRSSTNLKSWDLLVGSPTTPPSAVGTLEIA